MRAQQQRATVIPIVGARTRAQIQDSLGAVDIELSAEEIDRLEQVSRIDLGFPHEFAGRATAHGTTFELVDDHRRHVYTRLGPAPPARVGAEGSDKSAARAAPEGGVMCRDVAKPRRAPTPSSVANARVADDTWAARPSPRRSCGFLAFRRLPKVARVRLAGYRPQIFLSGSLAIA